MKVGAAPGLTVLGGHFLEHVDYPLVSYRRAKMRPKWARSSLLKRRSGRLVFSSRRDSSPCSSTVRIIGSTRTCLLTFWPPFCKAWFSSRPTESGDFILRLQGIL